MSPLFGASAENVLSRGTPARGRIIGIAIRYTHDDPPQRLDEYAVECNGEIYGIRQRLSPEGDVRLGMDVGLRIDGKVAVIEWGDVETYRWKSLGTPPAPGIDDDTEGLGGARKKWRPATITVLALTPRSVMLGMGTVLDLTVNVAIAGEEPYETTIPKISPAHYATHLVAVGSVVPAWVNPARLDKVQVDWAAGAAANPGVGMPSAVLGTGGEPISMMNVDAVTTAAASGDLPDVPVPGFLSKLGVTSTSPGDVEDPVSWDTFIAAFKATGNGAVQGAEADALATAAGVPAGEWDDAQARWMKRISRDMKLGIAFGQALNG
jgi:hypothetical protein